MSKKAITYYRRGRIERGIGGSYVWHEGYSANSPEGQPYYPWMTRGECRGDARAQGAVAVFQEEDKPAGTVTKVKGGFLIESTNDPLTGQPWEPGERRH